MNFEQAIDWLTNRLRFGIKPGLERMNLMLEGLGNPERKLRAVHVAGTNGKGSTVSFMRHMLQEAGYMVGTFTSPYIETFNERISVNGKPIADHDFVKIVKKLKPIVERVEQTDVGPPTEFEILTVTAFEYFANVVDLDIVIFEAGLGGRLDSTNVVKPLVSIITNIGHDHIDILGDTIEAITREKAGIIKNNVPIISSVSQEEAIRVISDIAEDNGSPFYLLGREFNYHGVKQSNEKEAFTFQSPFNEMKNLEISMKGEHQIKNATVALMAIEFLRQHDSFAIDEEQVRKGLLNTVWIGRFEKISSQPLIFIDGAHNPEGIDTLSATIQRYYSEKRVRLIFSAMKDKPLEIMIKKLDLVADKIIFTQFEFPRCAEAKDLYELSNSTNKHYNPNWIKVIEQEKQEMDHDEVLIITGSLYFISEVRKYLSSL